MGGLSCRDLRSFTKFSSLNKFGVFKQAWCFLNNPCSSLVAKVLLGRYFPSILLQTKVSQNCLFFWKGFVLGINLLKFGPRTSIGTGVSTHMFSDP